MYDSKLDLERQTAPEQVGAAGRRRILAIDVGNSRLKWGVSESGQWLARDRIVHADIPLLPARWRPLGDPDVVIVANVAGDAIRATLGAALGSFKLQPIWLAASASCCGVSNHYLRPSQLGADRWAALIAARHAAAGSCLVVNAGTATTLDSLTAGGDFVGGLILPGLGLMTRSLNLGTALIGADAGHYQGFPRSTRDAVYTGAVQATVGAIDRQLVAMEAAGHGPVHCVLTGGASDVLAPHITATTVRIETLVLDGLRYVADRSPGP